MDACARPPTGGEASTAARSPTDPARPAPAAGVVLVLIDGVGDVGGWDGAGAPPLPSPLPPGATPLQAAATPVLDAIAATGVLGLLDPVEPGRACGSDTAHLSLLGYDPRIYYRGRGAFEAMGAGLDMRAGDIAFKCNFACVEEEAGGRGGAPLVTSRRADRAFEADGPALCAALDGLPIPGFPDLTVRVKYATEHRAGVVLSAADSPPWLSDAVSGTDPLKDGRRLVRCVPTADAAAGCAGDPARTADAVNAVCAAFRRALASHPVNAARAARGARPATALLLRGCGVRLDAPPLAGGDAAAWSTAAVLAPTRIIRGLGASVGAALVDAPGGTGDYATALGSKADAAAAWLAAAAAAEGRSGDGRPAFLLLHVKAVDDAGHDRDPGLKAAWLGAVDAMVGRLAGRLAAEPATFILAATGDHSTPALFGDHSVEPVPFAASTVRRVAGASEGGGAGLLARYGGPDRIEPVPVVDAGGGQPGRQRCPFPPPPAFKEAAAAAGCLGRFQGAEVMPLLARLAAGWGGL